MLTVLVFGNPYLKEDSLAVSVAQALELPDVQFKITANLNDLLDEHYDAILDVAYGVPKVVLLEDVNKLREHRLVSLHDYDVTYFLKLMKAMGKISKVKIIAIPATYPPEKAMEEVTALLASLPQQ
ncbi:hypothetical protein GF367_00970 [Candidatus Woesearchaeota archaeon]|nr:hypothetical protein [Candidatus Woesearchaeota archaeon]